MCLALVIYVTCRFVQDAMEGDLAASTVLHGCCYCKRTSACKEVSNHDLGVTSTLRKLLGCLDKGSIFCSRRSFRMSDKDKEPKRVGSKDPAGSTSRSAVIHRDGNRVGSPVGMS